MVNYIMSQITVYLLFFVGIIGLLKWADYLVEGSSALAKKFKVPALVIGLTIVAFGTSMPELIVNILAALKWSSSIAFGNIVWSNLANLLLILWVTAIITPIKVQHSTIWKEIPFSLLAALLLLVFASTSFLDGTNIPTLTRSNWIVLILVFCVFLYYVVIQTKGDNKIAASEIESHSNLVITLMILWGLIWLYLWWQRVVNWAIAIAKVFGLSDFVISSTIVAIWTSLPELITSVKAAQKNNVDLAVWNVIGSNIFNVFWILWITAVIRPLSFPSAAYIDLIILSVVTILLFVFMFLWKRHTLQKRQGILFIWLYVLYTVGLLYRG